MSEWADISREIRQLRAEVGRLDGQLREVRRQLRRRLADLAEAERREQPAGWREDEATELGGEG